MRALYICYFGLREPLVQTQVLPYLRELVAGGVEMALLTFEPQRFDPTEWRERVREDGIEWEALPYHKRPALPATLYDIVRGASVARSAAEARGRLTIFAFLPAAPPPAAAPRSARWRSGCAAAD